MNIEVKYLDVAWADKNTVLRVDASRDSLYIDKTEVEYKVESTTFPQYHPRIGFRILDKTTRHTPFFVRADNSSQDLLAITDPTTHETWWIESTGWNKETKCHNSEIYRTVGTIAVKIQNNTLKVVNNSLRFTVEELESYLRDFKNDLWMLILNEQGYIKGSVEKDVPNIFSDEIIKHLSDYTDAIEHIVRRPTSELKEIQDLRPVRLVKPVKKTFMELAVKGNPKSLTSRASKESYDTPDNRYIHFTLKRALYVLNQVAKLGESQGNIYGRAIDAEQQRLQSISTEKKVDSSVFNNEIATIRNQIEELRSSLSKVWGQRGSGDVVSYSLRLGKEYGREGSGWYFAEYLDGDIFKDKFKTYLVVSFPAGVPTELLFDYKNRIEISVSGEATKEKDSNLNGKLFYRIKFNSVDAISITFHPLFNELDRLKKRAVVLEESEWKVPFTAKERKDVEIERSILQKKIGVFSKHRENVRYFCKRLSPTLSRLKGSKRFFEKNKVAVNSHFPNTMVFVQNPNYGSAKSMFATISNISGMDDGLFKKMLSVDDIGLVNISNLYEKWCLLQIIKILTEIYSFQMLNENWHNELIDAVSKKSYNIKFSMMSEKLGRSVILTYEKELSVSLDGKVYRPDYSIDIFDWNGRPLKTYILDAKFKDTLDDESLKKIVDSLCVTGKKDYSDNGKNKVFIIHPSDYAISNRSSPLQWGQALIMVNNVGHMRGGIYLSPSNKYGRSIDNLQRLIGLFLQETNSYVEEDLNVGRSHPFCMSCGNSDKSSLDVELKKTVSGSDKWQICCNDCNSIQVRSFCRGCRSPINKNGYYWTYHRTRAEEPFNVVCPSCEEFLT